MFQWSAIAKGGGYAFTGEKYDPAFSLTSILKTKKLTCAEIGRLALIIRGYG
jgi:hypothetical protein